MEINITLPQIAAVASLYFLFVAAKAFQQLNVMHHKVLLVPIFSIVMGLCEVFIWGGAALTAVHGTLTDMIIYALTLGSSGAAGAIVSMYIHKWMRGLNQEQGT